MLIGCIFREWTKSSQKLKLNGKQELIKIILFDYAIHVEMDVHKSIRYNLYADYKHCIEGVPVF